MNHVEALLPVSEQTLLDAVKSIRYLNETIGSVINDQEYPGPRDELWKRVKTLQTFRNTVDNYAEKLIQKKRQTKGE